LKSAGEPESTIAPKSTSRFEFGISQAGIHFPVKPFDNLCGCVSVP
jgi:hypothetical protein